MADANYKVVVDFQVRGQKEITNDMKEQGKATKNVTQSISALRNNLLSLMFVGMGIGRLFSAQVSRVSDLVGTTEVWNSFWTLALVRPMADITEKLSTLLTDFSVFPDKVQSATGWGIIAMETGGKGVAFLGAAALGLASLANFLSGGTGLAAAASTGGLAAGSAIAAGILGGLAIAGLVATVAAGAITLGVIFSAKMEKELSEYQWYKDLDAILRRWDNYVREKVGAEPRKANWDKDEPVNYGAGYTDFRSTVSGAKSMQDVIKAGGGRWTETKIEELEGGYFATINGIIYSRARAIAEGILKEGPAYAWQVYGNEMQGNIEKTPT